MADRLSFRISAFRLSVVADSTSFQVFSFQALSSSSFHALSSGSVQDLSVHAASLADRLSFRISVVAVFRIVAVFTLHRWRIDCLSGSQRSGSQ